MQDKKAYEKPEIIYQDILKTRAGSPLGGPDPDPVTDPFDPAEIFKK